MDSTSHVHDDEHTPLSPQQHALEAHDPVITNDFPNDILLEISSYLPINNIFTMLLVNRNWFSALQSTSVWDNIIEIKLLGKWQGTINRDNFVRYCKKVVKKRREEVLAARRAIAKKKLNNDMHSCNRVIFTVFCVVTWLLLSIFFVLMGIRDAFSSLSPHFIAIPMWLQCIL
jgi:hypothetical protein